ncbi:MAG: DUF4263 domain-containing protein [Chloroflexota bacterium]|nr:DUF4263 domain-containing protein [Chloroflexota bacterium]
MTRFYSKDTSQICGTLGDAWADYFTFHPPGIPKSGPDDGDEIAINIGGDQGVVEIAQQLSGWIEFSVPEDGRSYRFDLAGFEIHGVVSETGGAFVGSPPWKWITLTNSFARDHWNPQLAGERAAKNVQTAAAAHLLGLSQSGSGFLQQQETRTLGHFDETIQSFRLLLEKHADEASIQPFLEQHPILLASDAVVVKSQVRLGGEYVADFVIGFPESRYVLVGIEAASHPLFTRTKQDPTAALTHAQKQVEDWRDWIVEAPDYIRKTLPGISEPECWVVIGRRPTEPRQRKALARRNKHLHRFTILTYDDLLDGASWQLTNLRRLGEPRRCYKDGAK